MGAEVHAGAGPGAGAAASADAYGGAAYCRLSRGPKTAQYVAEKYRAAGLETKISEYKVWFNYPKQITVEIIGANGQVIGRGPTPEHVEGDPLEDDPRIVMAYNSSSPSGDVTAEAVYVNYGTLADFKKLKEMGVDLRGKIAVVRYGANFRGVKSYVANQFGCAGVIIYSDPIDDGYFKGDMYPKGPWRPASGVQRGSVQEIFKFCRGPDHTGRGIGAEPAGERAHRSKLAGEQHGADPDDTVELQGCGADPGESAGGGGAGGVAGRAALHLSRGPGAGEGAHEPGAGLCLANDLGRDRDRAGDAISRGDGGDGEPSRRVGVRRGGSQQRHGGATGSGARDSANC